MESQEEKTRKINKFFEGRDATKYITAIEYDYADDYVSVIFWEDGVKKVKREDFKPFVWAKHSVAIRMFNGDRQRIKREMERAGIGVKALLTSNDGSLSDRDRLANGYRFLFFAKRKMAYRDFTQFFTNAGTPIRGKKKGDSPNKEFLSVAPIEQHMMYTGKRLFKGYDNYDDIKRMMFDLETSGLNPEKDHIDQIGIRTNRGFEIVLSVDGEGDEKKTNELDAINRFFQIIADEQPDVIAGHNSEKFDWFFIEERCKRLGTSMDELSRKYFRFPIYKKKKDTALKLGGEVEYYKPTVAWGFNMLDSLHAVRRAQASDSSMESGNLKYVTKYLHLEKKNRVYVTGNQIGTTWRENGEVFAFNEENGDWYRVSEKRPLQEGYKLKSGRYIVERYLLDDIYETDKVECKMNECNFLIGKLIPTTFQRACTMGTAGIWKLIILGWCLENGLAIPAFGESRKFTGGLSRLLRTGLVERVVKLDYNSLYPSILLTFDIRNDYDISNIMLGMLEYVLTEREKYKELKKSAGKRANQIREMLEKGEIEPEKIGEMMSEMEKQEGIEVANDKKQLPMKTLGNSYFGSCGAPSIFPFGNILVSEKTTCIGRMQLRLMISHFANLGYSPIVGDSFTGDTPVFVRSKKTGLIDIVPIEELIDVKKIRKDILGREYDYSSKDYEVLCRSGWMEPSYIYRHKTGKDIYKVTEGGMECEITEDHSLFNDRRRKISPKDVNGDTRFEYISAPEGKTDANELSEMELRIIVNSIKVKRFDRVPVSVLNSTLQTMSKFDKMMEGFDTTGRGKALLAGLRYVKTRIKEQNTKK